MGRCEKQVAFEHLHGSRRTASQQRDRKRGLLAHQQFQREGLEAQAAAGRRQGRCFIATCVFGDTWQTQILRRFRDEVLRPKPWGRRLIWRYYRAAPAICVVLRRRPLLQGVVRAALRLVTVTLRWWLGLSGEAE